MVGHENVADGLSCYLLARTGYRKNCLWEMLVLRIIAGQMPE